jgi:acyl-CoA thioester hydrolase
MDSAVAPTIDPGLSGRSARPFDGIDNGFETAYRVRFDEAGPDGLVQTATLLRYAQDVAWRHSEHLGFDRGWYQERGLGWVARAVELELHEPIPMGHTLRVSTAVIGHRRIWARRLGECRLHDGRLAARVITDWVLIDARGRLVRIPEDFGLAFTNPELAVEIMRVPERPDDDRPVAGMEIAVRPRDLDPMGHVNNAVYVDWLEEALAAAWGPAQHDRRRRMRLEYLASAGPGDTARVAVSGGPDDWFARIEQTDGPPLVRARGGLQGS